MRLQIERLHLVISTENVLDVVYIEEVLNTRCVEDKCLLIRMPDGTLQTRQCPQERELVSAWVPTSIAEFLAHHNKPNTYQIIVGNWISEVCEAAENESLEELGLSSLKDALKRAVRAEDYTLTAAIAIMIRNKMNGEEL